MAKDKVVCAIDIGSSKITTLIATLGDGERVNLIGVSSVASKGVRKAQIIDIEDAVGAITESLEAAERMAGYSISSVFASIGGPQIESRNSHAVVAIAKPNGEIEENDVLRVNDGARAITLPSSTEILHVIPRSFTVDGQEGIKDPVGMTGVRLEVDTHLITVSSTARKNLEKCISEVGVETLGFVFGGLASSEAVLTETEKELGIILVDFGAGTTDICIYVDGALAYSSVLPIGAKNITNDIAIGLRVSLESAEKIKLFLGKQIKKPALPVDNESKKEFNKKLNQDDIDLSGLSLPEDVRSTTKRTLIDGIIKPRLNEIFTMIGLEVKRSGFVGLTPAGVVITGGGAETTGIIEAAKRSMAMPVRLGIPGEKITGLIEEILAPSYATSIGLVLYGSKFEVTSEKPSFNFKGLSKFAQKIPIKGMGGKLIDLVKSFLP